MQEMILHPEHHYVLDRLQENSGLIFLTGKAGTGKSTMLQLFRKLTDRALVVLAPTGVAAVHNKGQTIHSFFKFPPGWIEPHDIKPIAKKLAAKIDMILIDEISMVRADMIDHIDQCLQKSRGNKQAFGGIPMVWIGDPFQLPPVVSSVQEKEIFRKWYKSPYFFDSKAFNGLKDFEMIELHQVFRQEEMYFLRLLNEIRMGELDEDGLITLNERRQVLDEKILHMHLCTTNHRAQIINQKRMHSLPGQAKIYKASISGTVLSSQHPNDEMLTLKPGAQVMFIRNDPEKKWHNGSLGVIVELRDAMVKVQLEDSETIVEVERVVWEMIKYSIQAGDMPNAPSLKSEVVGSFSQFPIKAAWAITIHKSQGKTFEKVHIDLGSGAFEHGQLYVALSRCKTLEGISLETAIKLNDLQCDERVIDFMRKFS